LSNGQETREAPAGSQPGWRPVPDPTLLTTEALLREIKGLRELMELKIDSWSSGMQSQILLFREISTVKFSKVEQQFELVERQRVEQKSDTKQAVDAALTAQKEAVKEQTIASDKAISKSETGTSKQIEQLSDNFKTAIAGITTVLDDLKGRVGGIENRARGSQEVRGEGRQNYQWLIGLGVLVFASVLTASVALLIAFHK
jgi:hypothetical protein